MYPFIASRERDDREENTPFDLCLLEESFPTNNRYKNRNLFHASKHLLVVPTFAQTNRSSHLPFTYNTIDSMAKISKTWKWITFEIDELKEKRNFCSSSSGTRGDQQGAAFRIVSALGLLLGENGRRVAAYDHVARCLPYHQLPDVGLPQSGSFCHPAGVSLTQHHRRTGTPLLPSYLSIGR